MSAVFEVARLKDHEYAFSDTSEAPEIDLEAAARAVFAFPGKVIVVVWPEREKQGQIYLADGTKNHMKPDVGTVIAFGGDWEPDGDKVDEFGDPVMVRLPDELQPGDKVLLKSQAGKCVEGFWTGSWGPFYKDSQGEWQCHEVRMYGTLGGGTFNDHGDPVLAPMTVPWNHGVLAKMTDEGFQPLKDNILFEYDDLEDAHGHILVPDSHKVRKSLVTAIEIGPKVKRTEPGDKFWLHEGAVRDTSSSQGLVSEQHVYALVR